MTDDCSISDDPGTILDSYESVLRAKPTLPPIPSPAIATPTEEVLYRTPYRWTAPRILICDDNSLDEGEIIYLRSERITIGRTKGEIVIGHDVAMSGAHAEIVRKDAGGKFAWVLRDLSSSNGTLVRAKAVTLKPGMTVLIGSKRYRFEQHGALQPTVGGKKDEPGTTLLADLGSTPADALPALVESGKSDESKAARFPFRSICLRIGRPGLGNEIEIDDLCLAGTHAVITRDHTGAWQLESQPSLNGVWVKVESVKLIDNCLFQCGEQRFRFRM